MNNQFYLLTLLTLLTLLKLLNMFYILHKYENIKISKMFELLNHLRKIDLKIIFY